MIGYIAFWNGTSGKIMVCPGNIKVFPFLLSGVADAQLAAWLQQCGSFADPGPCPGKVRVQFVSQDGLGVRIQRLQLQLSFQDLALGAAAPTVQPLRAINRIPISTPELSLAGDSPLSGQLSTGLEILHPKAAKPLNSVLHLSLKKPADARVTLTVHHGAKTQNIHFPFGKKVSGNKQIKLKTPPQPGMGGVHHVAIHAHVQRKNKKSKVTLNLKHIAISSK